jgi:hypothetical protein
MGAIRLPSGGRHAITNRTPTGLIGARTGASRRCRQVGRGGPTRAAPHVADRTDLSGLCPTAAMGSSRNSDQAGAVGELRPTRHSLPPAHAARPGGAGCERCHAQAPRVPAIGIFPAHKKEVSAHAQVATLECHTARGRRPRWMRELQKFVNVRSNGFQRSAGSGEKPRRRWPRAQAGAARESDMLADGSVRVHVHGTSAQTSRRLSHFDCHCEHGRQEMGV